MQKLTQFSRTPCGQVFLATLLFCFMFATLICGLYKAGAAYILKERSRRATNLTALTAGAVYANGLQLVREANLMIMAAAAFDILVISEEIAGEIALLPESAPLLIETAEKGDPNTRGLLQDTFAWIFGIERPGVFPALIEGQSVATANENNLSCTPPVFAYNYETGTAENVMVPNMALRFRHADELLTSAPKSIYSLMHDGVREYFSSEQVESAMNPRHPSQMRVKKGGPSKYAGWWVRKELNKNGGVGPNPILSLGPISKLKFIKDFLHKFKLDITDRDDPPCHTFSLLSTMKGNFIGKNRDFSQLGEVRIETDDLAAWNQNAPFDVYLTKVNIDAFPVLRESFRSFYQTPLLNQILKTSDLLSGL